MTGYVLYGTVLAIILYRTVQFRGEGKGMRKSKVVSAVLAGFLVVASAPFAGADPRPGGPGGAPPASSVPDSLDAFYPPAAKAPVYLFGMASLEESFSGIAADLMEEDLDGARGSFRDFQGRYREVAGMVPEWKGEFPEDKVGELGAALAAGDRGRAMEAFAAVGGICHRCHVASMAPVQQRYRWGNFGAVTVRDPLSGALTGYAQFKKFLAVNLAGITVDLRQGQTGNARKQFEGFKARFRALADSCGGCHEGTVGNYVGRDIQEALDGIGKAFGSGEVAADTVTALVRKIGGESCSKCHLVHVPAALAAASRR